MALHVEACAGARQNDGGRVDSTTLYDLGALTESFVAMAALRMAARGDIDLRAPVAEALPELRGSLPATSLVALFEHRGGLAESGGLYLDVPHALGSRAARRWILTEAARRSGESPERSDLGYLIAGEALARLAGAPLHEVVHAEVSCPLGLDGGRLAFPGALPTERRRALVARAAPTERCRWRGRLLAGEVQDENAAALGGVAGHAGLFGSAETVASFGRGVLDAHAGRGEFLEQGVVHEALEVRGEARSARFGWDVDAARACGRRMSPATFGKVGFTGTSLFCDPERDVVIALLTNRICPSRANEKIHGFRPAFHDGVMAALFT